MSSKFRPVDFVALRRSSAPQAAPRLRSPEDRLSPLTQKYILGIAGVAGYGFPVEGEIVVYVKTMAAVRQLPRMLDGMRVRAEVTGGISAL